MTQSDVRYAFFLGGRDLEMVEIAALLSQLHLAGDGRVVTIHDLSLPWGAKASDYGDAIWIAHGDGLTPVLIELIENMPLPRNRVSIDHHGARSGEPSSLAQVFALLDLPAFEWTRRRALVDANDRGHIAAMQTMGATREEIEAIRTDDRRAQGISREEEDAARAAMTTLREELSGTLLVAELPHARTAALCDPLVLSGETRDLVIFCPQSTQFFGDGKRVTGLDVAFPGGWRGGQLPLRGYWGIPRRLDQSDVVSLLSSLE